MVLVKDVLQGLILFLNLIFISGCFYMFNMNENSLLKTINKSYSLFLNFLVIVVSLCFLKKYR